MAIDQLGERQGLVGLGAELDDDHIGHGRSPSVDMGLAHALVVQGRDDNARQDAAVKET
jgi:hypothetical protein